MRCGSGIQLRIGFSDVFFTSALDIEVFWRSFMRDKFLISRDETVNNC